MDILKVKVNNEWVAIPSITGPRGIGIQSITKTNTQGLVDTYTILFSDGNSTTFNISNGAVPSFTIGTVTEGPTAAVTVTGTNTNPVLNLTLPNANVPTAVSELSNDAGYATESYVNTAISNVNTMKIHICAQGEYNAETGIPTIQNPDTQTFYLVPGGEGNNLFIEWAYVNGAWERFGSADIDLSNYVQKTDYATASNAGVIKLPSDAGLTMFAGQYLMITPASLEKIKSSQSSASPITTGVQHASTFYGLAKAAGDSTQSASSNAVGTYTAEAKTAIQQMLDVPSTSDIPEVPVQDVQVNGVSIVNDGVANVAVMSSSNYGVAKINTNYGVGLYNGQLQTQIASVEGTKIGTDYYHPISPYNQHAATFYGLAKASGDTTQSQSSNAVGIYTPEAKQSIQQMLGISNLLAPTETTTASKAYSIGEVFTSNGKLYKAIAAIAAADAIVVQNQGEEVSGHNAEEVKVADYAVHDVQVNGMSVVSGGVANVPVATNVAAGVARFISGYGIYMNSEDARIVSAYGSEVKAGTHQYRPITPSNQDAAAFYGLAKAAGDSTQVASANAVGTYTDEAKAAIKSMIGVNVEDVQINGTSIITDGVANIPIAKRYNNDGGALGVVSIGQGLVLTAAGMLFTDYATTTSIKNGTTYYQPITPVNQHASAFYGLAKAAGDTTQSASSNAVGVYTDNAKASIKSMLGIVDGSTGTVDITGTTPTITAVENTRYVCGEVSTLSFTPAASGTCIVRFTSGSTATVLTLPSTVKFPEWFDATALEADTIYEICVTDGIYGAVMSWAL